MISHYAMNIIPYTPGFVLRDKKTFLKISLILICSVFGYMSFKTSMKSLESKECYDVLDDCAGVNFNDTIIPPFYNYLQDYAVVPKYNIALCQIPKVMSTIGTGVFCYLRDSKRFTEHNRSIALEEYTGRFCEETEVKSVKMVNHLLGEKSEKMVITRDPFDRFISGFTEKCIKKMDHGYCYGCGYDVRCFLRKEYRRLKRMSMLFPVYTVADTHFAPQTWFCGLKQLGANQTYIRYGHNGEEGKRMVDEMSKVFERNNVPQFEIDTIRSELLKGKSHHSTSGDKQRIDIENLVYNDPAIRKALLRMYYHDFKTFGYQFEKNSN